MHDPQNIMMPPVIQGSLSTTCGKVHPSPHQCLAGARAAGAAKVAQLGMCISHRCWRLCTNGVGRDCQLPRAWASRH